MADAKDHVHELRRAGASRQQVPQEYFDEGELEPDTTISQMEIVVNRGYRGEVS